MRCAFRMKPRNTSISTSRSNSAPDFWRRFHATTAGVLNSLLRNGAPCTLWVATFKTPSPFFYSTEIRVVYAVEIDGVVHKAIHKAIKEVARGWTSGKWITVAMLAMIGLFTILLYIGILFWINAIRLSFVELPLDEMRREPA